MLAQHASVGGLMMPDAAKRTSYCSSDKGEGIRPLQYKWGTHIARGSKENLVSNLKGAAGENNQPREEVFQDLSACQTNSQTTHSSNGQHTVDCSKESRGWGHLHLVAGHLTKTA